MKQTTQTKTQINDIIKSLKNIRESRKEATRAYLERIDTLERTEKYFLMMLSQLEDQK